MCAQATPEAQCPICFEATYHRRQELLLELLDGRITRPEYATRYLDAGRWTNPGDAQVAAEGARY